MFSYILIVAWFDIIGYMSNSIKYFIGKILYISLFLLLKMPKNIIYIIVEIICKA